MTDVPSPSSSSPSGPEPTAAPPSGTAARAREQRLPTRGGYVAAALCLGVAAVVATLMLWPSSDGVEVTSAVATPAPAGGAGAVYLTIENHGPADQLVGVRVDEQGPAELHGGGGSGSRSLMTEIPAVELPDGQTVRLSPTTGHAMVEALERDWAAGDRLGVVLSFRDAGERRIEVPVVDHSEADSRLE